MLPESITPTNKYVVKSLDTALFYDGSQEYFTYSSVVGGNELSESNIKDAPIILQEFLEDKRDIRVTVIGNKLFPVGITKNGENIYGDWRKNAKEFLQYKPELLPDDISNGIMKLMNELGLLFGGVDLAFSNGKYYFIEVNPTGEWGWLSQYGAIPLEKAIVNELVGET
jgi:glutathione synthase/RimK-type ligase-like ATP-grasp enzyme